MNYLLYELSTNKLDETTWITFCMNFHLQDWWDNMNYLLFELSTYKIDATTWINFCMNYPTYKIDETT